MRKILPVAVLGLTGFFGVAACTAEHPAISLAPPPTRLLPPLSTAPADNGSVARYLARIAVGHGGLPALGSGHGQATAATCDPGTVLNPRQISSATSAVCGINYSDGSVWKQKLTVVFDSHGHPAADSTDLGTEVLQPAGGRGEAQSRSACARACQGRA